MEEKKHLSIRMDGELHNKLQFVAAYEGRSMSRQILYLINQCVREFEKEHGPIRPEDLD
ncbi:Arc family DNA-binding protein [Pseudoflavonifractor hominis]|uniref:Arc family DNA-binding protein n=1 Tax=Pseudoflavonifractor hominis TaxID=2763059 RepID=A0ABR7HQ86_9FIRM|nr:Arc family DNA-binding protein [Pseudoflavonifractor hominis]MBC5729688.1 Arc family DNA-binding protein [Pseudoflavonifractor hominis]